MASPFATTSLRRFWAFVGLWGLTVASIVVRATVRRERQPFATLDTVGVFYHGTRVALAEFARTAAVPAWLPLLIYGVLAVALFGIAVAVLDWTAFDPDTSSLVVLYLYFVSLLGSVVVFVLLLALVPVYPDGNLLSLVVAGATPGGVVSFVLQVAPQALTLGVLAVVISILTSYVP